MKKIIVCIVCICFALIIFAEQSVLSHEIHVNYSNNKKYYVQSDYENNITGCYANTENNTNPLWKIAGCYEDMYIKKTKIYINKNDGILYAVKNGKFVRYEYEQ